MPLISTESLKRPALTGGVFLFLLAGGCVTPNYQHVAATLRDENIQLKSKNSALETQVNTERQTVKELKDQLADQTPRVPTLPQERLDQMFTVQSVEVLPQTGLADMDHTGKADGFRVFLRTHTDDGTTFPASGDVQIEADEYTPKDGPRRLGQWHFTPEDCKKSWYGMLGLNHFAFNCPWKEPPSSSPDATITFRLTFTDVLTGRVLEAKKDLKLKPAATQASG